jgi:endonuclease G
MYSGVSRTPLWSAEHLTPQRLKQARSLDRKNTFHEESRIPDRYRSHLSDYAHSGYDRGHMAPNGDMATRQQQQDSFSLANMVPQSPKNNQEVWRNLEEATRALVTRQKQDAYVITGPAFLKSELQQVGRVLVPTHVYKVVYFPKLNIAGAYFAPNNESGEVDVVSIQELEETIGINLVPEMSAAVKAKRIMLPLNAKQASKSIQSWANNAGHNKADNSADAYDGYSDHSNSNHGSSGHSNGHKNAEHSWLTAIIEMIKQQLLALLTALISGKG